MSEEYRKVQYVSVVDPMYPKLHGKALPVSRWVLSQSDEILGVFVMMGGVHEVYLKRSQVKLYVASDEQVVLVTQQHTGGLFDRLKKFLTTPHQR